MPYRASGFTLLEVLTVLFIIGMTSAIVGPQLPKMKDRLEFAVNRETLEENLGNLAYQAFRDNRDYVLQGTFDSEGPVKAKSEDESTRSPRARVEPAIGQLAVLPPIAPVVPKLRIPPEWRVIVDDPIYFMASGYCRGGRIEVTVGALSFFYHLDPPSCAMVAE